MRIVKSISLSEGLVKFLEDQVKEGYYVSISEYLRELIREEKERQLLKDIQESEDDYKAGRVVKNAKSVIDLM